MNNETLLKQMAGMFEAIQADGDQIASPELDCERKYRLRNPKRWSIPRQQLAFQGLLNRLVNRRKPPFDLLPDSGVFTGIDHCFELEGKPGNDEVLLLRFRFGSNCGCWLNTKVRSKSRDNTARLCGNAHFPFIYSKQIRAMLAAMDKVAYKSRSLMIGQTGHIWLVKDALSGHTVEIVLYTVGLLDSPSDVPPQLLLEVAPWGCPDVETALALLERYEKLLGLKGRREMKSNMELFPEH